MLLTMLGCGFLLLRPDIPNYWIWMFWLSPLQYALTGMANNELLADSYDKIIPEISPDVPLGRFVLETYGVNVGNEWRCAPHSAALVRLACGSCLLTNFCVAGACHTCVPVCININWRECMDISLYTTQSNGVNYTVRM